jgi:hypothetical protein
MADTLAVDLKASISWLFSDSLDLSTVSDNAKLEHAVSTADGTGLDQADKLWHDQRTVAAGSDDDLDMTALANSIFGSSVSISFAKVKAILIVNTSTTSGQVLRVGGAGAGLAFATPFNGSVTAVVEVGADSCLMLMNKKDGWAVTPTTGDLLRVANPGASPVTYKVVIIGTSV